MPDAPGDEMREPIRVGPTKGPRCVWGCDGYGWHARNCPDSPDYDPNWIDELAAQIKRDIEQNVRTDTPAETRELVGYHEMYDAIVEAYPPASVTSTLGHALRALIADYRRLVALSVPGQDEP